MKVFMLGWEFPPVVSGGLGVACYGLVKALNAMGTDVLFVLPKPLTQNGHDHHTPPHRPVTQTRHLPRVTESDVHAAIVDAQHATESHQQAQRPQPAPQNVQPQPPQTPPAEPAPPEKLHRVTFVPVDSPLTPYMTPGQYQRMVVEEYIRDHAGGRWVQRATSSGPHDPAPQPANSISLPPKGDRTHFAPGKGDMIQFGAPRRYLEDHATPPANPRYAADLFAETERYARLALAVAKGGGESFDIIHAHDWMTFEAGMAVAADTGKPFVVQIHSTELDRAGVNAHPKILEVERQGMTFASRIIAVSYKTKTQLIEKYGIDSRKIEVVYNAPDSHIAPGSPHIAPGLPGVTPPTTKRHDTRTVLFLGRLAQQKGPDLFLQAAKKVLSVNPDVTFIIAGQGEMLDALQELAENLHIRHHVIFTGFLHKKEREKALRAADVYVMPSISEPFGIASLDALSHDVPVIISKQSGVAEVLRHVLKVDFWDTEDLANKILAVLRHPPLAATLREQGHEEVRQLSWEDSAARIIHLYRELMAGRVSTPATPEPQASSAPSAARS